MSYSPWSLLPPLNPVPSPKVRFPVFICLDFLHGPSEEGGSILPLSELIPQFRLALADEIRLGEKRIGPVGMTVPVGRSQPRAAGGVANHEKAVSLILVTVPRFSVRTAHIIRAAHLLMRDIDLPHREAYAHLGRPIWTKGDLERQGQLRLF